MPRGNSKIVQFGADLVKKYDEEPLYLCYIESDVIDLGGKGFPHTLATCRAENMGEAIANLGTMIANFYESDIECD